MSIPKYPEDIKQEWVAALRSGKYKQGRHKLHCRTTNTYCCLGVLAEILYQKKEFSITKQTKGSTFDSVYYDDEGACLSSDICAKIGVSYNDHSRIEYLGNKHSSLIALNDDEGLSFNEIADLIEEQY